MGGQESDGGARGAQLCTIVCSPTSCTTTESPAAFHEMYGANSGLLRISKVLTRKGGTIGPLEARRRPPDGLRTKGNDDAEDGRGTDVVVGAVAPRDVGSDGSAAAAAAPPPPLLGINPSVGDLLPLDIVSVSLSTLRHHIRSRSRAPVYERLCTTFWTHLTSTLSHICVS